MKKLLTLLALSCGLSLSAAAQTAPATTAPAATRTEEYCMVLVTAKMLSNKVTITIDFGQERRFFADNRYRDEEGKVQTFNSVIDALNYMNSQGWEFVNAYAITVNGLNVYHYVMKRKVSA